MQEQPKNREWVKNAAIIFLAVLLVLTFFSNTIMNRSLPEVATQEVTDGSIVARVRGTGTVTAVGSSQVKAEKTRVIRSVLVKTGQQIEAGDVLFTLGEGSSEDIEAAENELADLQSSYRRTAASMPQHYYTTQERNIINLERAMDEAEENLRIAEKAVMMTATNQDQIDEVERELERAIKARDIAKEEYDDARGDITDPMKLPQAEELDPQTQRAINALRTFFTNKKYNMSVLDFENLQDVIIRVLVRDMLLDGDLLNDEYYTDRDKITIQITRTTEKINSDSKEDDEGETQTTSISVTPSPDPIVSTDPITISDSVDPFELITTLDPEPDPIEYPDPLPPLDVLLDEDAQDTAPAAEEFPPEVVEYFPDEEYLPIESEPAFDVGFEEPKSPLTGEEAEKPDKDWYEIKIILTDALDLYDRIQEQIYLKEQVVNQKKAVYDEAAAEAEKWATALQTLLDTGSAESAVYKAKLAAYNSAVDAYLTAKESLEESMAYDSRTDAAAYIDLSESMEKVERAKKKLAELTGGEDQQVVAKVSGTIQSIECTAGETKQKDDVLCTIEVPDMGYTLSFTVTNDQANRLRPGDTATVSNFYWGTEIVATLNSIKVDPKNPQTNKLLTFDLDGNVTAGSELTISVGQKSANYDTIIPSSSIRSDSNGTFVLKVDAKNSPLGTRYVARRVPVEVLASDDSNSAVTADLGYGDYVITTSSAPVKNGELVRLSSS